MIELPRQVRRLLGPRCKPYLSRNTTFPEGRATTRLPLKQEQSLTTSELLLNDASTLAIRTDVETEGGISRESLSVHPGKHRALDVDVIMDFNG